MKEQKPIVLSTYLHCISSGYHVFQGTREGRKEIGFILSIICLFDWWWLLSSADFYLYKK
jgi:hypothetical protein